MSQPLEPQRTRPRVLIIENDIDVCQQLRAGLERDYSLTHVQTGLDALRSLEHEPADLILLDMSMPDMVGPGLLTHLRSSAQATDVPVILIAARPNDAEIVWALQQGANDTVTRPLNMELVRARIKNQLALKKRLDEQQQTITTLKKRYEIKDNFLKIASHDLKNPLNNILLAHYQLRSVVGDDPDATEALNFIEDTVQSMNELVEDYLNSEALENGRTDVELTPVEIQAAIADVVLRYSVMASRKSIDLQVQDSPAVVMADYGRLIQILSNLISNAIKFSAPGSIVTIETKGQDKAIRIQVRDKGPGIPTDERANLFKPFSKLSPRPTAGESSIGLGLWIVKELAALQNGTVDVDCPEDGGSVFWVELPAAQQA